MHASGNILVHYCSKIATTVTLKQTGVGWYHIKERVMDIHTRIESHTMLQQCVCTQLHSCQIQETCYPNHRVKAQSAPL